jgi:hypothetical protein
MARATKHSTGPRAQLQYTAVCVVCMVSIHCDTERPSLPLLHCHTAVLQAELDQHSIAIKQVLHALEGAYSRC